MNAITIPVSKDTGQNPFHAASGYQQPAAFAFRSVNISGAAAALCRCGIHILFVDIR
jgi:hypothetical protein